MGSWFSTQAASLPAAAASPQPVVIKGTGQCSIKVVTYNILAACFQHHLRYVPQKYLEFSYRRKRIGEFLLSVEDADFICLQEVDHFEDYYEKFLRKIGYKMCFAHRAGGGQHDGSLIAWKASQWTPCFMERIDFDMCPEAENNRDYVRHNAGVIGVFSNSDSEKVLVGTAHLFWNPEYEDVKLAQAKFFLSKIESSLPLSTLGIIITGDFNAMPESAVYKYIVNRTREAGWSLQSAYRNYHEGSHPAFTNFTDNFQGTLDYIFHCERLSVESIAPLPDEAECRKEIALPNSKYGSDHLPLVAVLRSAK